MPTVRMASWIPLAIVLAAVLVYSAGAQLGALPMVRALPPAEPVKAGDVLNVGGKLLLPGGQASAVLFTVPLDKRLIVTSYYEANGNTLVELDGGTITEKVT